MTFSEILELKELPVTARLAYAIIASYAQKDTGIAKLTITG